MLDQPDLLLQQGDVLNRDEGKAVNVIYTDLVKHLTLSHSMVLEKLVAHGLEAFLLGKKLAGCSGPESGGECSPRLSVGASSV